MSLDAEAWGSLALYQLSYPIRFDYLIGGDWGSTRQSLTVDAPGVGGNGPAILELGILLWQRAIAGAITSSTLLTMGTAHVWKEPALSNMLPPIGARGALSGAAAPRERSAVLVLHHGRGDALPHRRLYFGGIPDRWTASGLLTHVGLRAMEGTAQAMVMGMCGHLTGGPLAWLVEYPGLIAATPDNPTGTLFRRVEYIAAAHHLDRAPLV